MSPKVKIDPELILKLKEKKVFTDSELRGAFKLTPAEIAGLEAADFGEHDLFIQKVEGRTVYHLLKDQVSNKRPVIQPKIWSYAQCKDASTPYVWIKFPATKWKNLRIVPISDLHWGSKECDKKRFLEYVEWIKNTENVFCFLNGDIIDNALTDSPGGAIFDNTMTPSRQAKSITGVLAQIAHKILWAQPGNHEQRTMKRTDFDPLYWICRELEIPYYDQPLFADILWNGNRFNFYCMHGTGGGRTPGGKLNTAVRPMEFTDFIMFYVMGHVHDPINNPIIRRCILREYDEKGGLAKLRVVDRVQHTVIASAWLDFFGGYGARAGYAPPPRGATACILNADGSYNVSS
jgi:hypothetical protein